MERYDGKTKKDDYIKYGLIAVGIITLIILFKLFTGWLYRVSHPTPDMTIVIASQHVVDFSIEDSLEKTLSAYVPDVDDNGKAIVKIVDLHLVENEAITLNGLEEVGAKSDIDLLHEYLSEGTYALFLLSGNTAEPPNMNDLLGVYPSIMSFFNESYCCILPEDIADNDNPYCADLTGCFIFVDIGWERVPFYGCIQKDASEEDYALAVSLLRTLRENKAN